MELKTMKEVLTICDLGGGTAVQSLIINKKTPKKPWDENKAANAWNLHSLYLNSKTISVSVWDIRKRHCEAKSKHFLRKNTTPVSHVLFQTREFIVSVDKHWKVTFLTQCWVLPIEDTVFPNLTLGSTKFGGVISSWVNFPTCISDKKRWHTIVCTKKECTTKSTLHFNKQTQAVKFGLLDPCVTCHRTLVALLFLRVLFHPNLEWNSCFFRSKARLVLSSCGVCLFVCLSVYLSVHFSPPKILFHFCFFCHFWMFHVIFCPFQILVKVSFNPPPQNAAVPSMPDFVHFPPDSSCGWSKQPSISVSGHSENTFFGLSSPPDFFQDYSFLKLGMKRIVLPASRLSLSLPMCMIANLRASEANWPANAFELNGCDCSPTSGRERLCLGKQVQWRHAAENQTCDST